MIESRFQKKLIDEIERLFPGCVVFKTDPTYIRSFPDLIVLYRHYWAALETKRTPSSKKRPNQDYWVRRLDECAYASFVNPSNKEEVLRELEFAFRSA